MFLFLLLLMLAATLSYLTYAQALALKEQKFLSYSWHFSRYRAPIQWLVHGYMMANNETVYCTTKCHEQATCEKYDVKRETVQLWLCRSESQALVN